MSQYTTYSIATMRSEEVLLATLASLGWDSSKVEVHETPQTLYGYHGDARPEKAHIVIRRNNTGVSSSNDIGFFKEADGTYRPIISQYDNNACARGYGNKTVEGNGKLSSMIETGYGRIAGDKALNTLLTKTVPRMKLQGLIERSATAKIITVGSVRQLQIVNA